MKKPDRTGLLNTIPQHRQPSTTGTQPKSLSITSLGTAPISYPQSLRDRLISPEMGEVVMREATTDQCPHQSSLAKLLPHATGTSSAATAPPKRKGKGRSKPNDDLPTNTPPLSADADTWVHFMHPWQLGQMWVEDDWVWNQVFPGALWGSPIDGHEVDPLPLHIRAVRSFLIVQRLMPQSQFNMGWNPWRRMAAQLFGIVGQYCSMISWAGSVPGGTATWFGASDGSCHDHDISPQPSHTYSCLLAAQTPPEQSLTKPEPTPGLPDPSTAFPEPSAAFPKGCCTDVCLVSIPEAVNTIPEHI